MGKAEAAGSDTKSSIRYNQLLSFSTSAQAQVTILYSRKAKNCHIQFHCCWARVLKGFFMLEIGKIVDLAEQTKGRILKMCQAEFNLSQEDSNSEKSENVNLRKTTSSLLKKRDSLIMCARACSRIRTHILAFFLTLIYKKT